MALPSQRMVANPIELSAGGVSTCGDVMAGERESCLLARRTERKIGSALERFPFRAWCVARAVVASRILDDIYSALALMIPVLLSTTLFMSSGRAPIAMSRAQSYISSALEGRPLNSSQSP